jgi:hypothetical protein
MQEENQYEKNINISISNKKFCKFCFESGKSEEEYSSHFVREKKENKKIVVCPTLLNIECNYCHIKGHTIKYCNILKEKEKKITQVEKKISSSKNINILSIESEDEEDKLDNVYKININTENKNIINEDNEDYKDNEDNKDWKRIENMLLKKPKEPLPYNKNRSVLFNKTYSKYNSNCSWLGIARDSENED